jgi:hypothetical protein
MITNEVAHEILIMDLDDTRRGPFLEELSVLTRLRPLLRLGSGSNRANANKNGELA